MNQLQYCFNERFELVMKKYRGLNLWHGFLALGPWVENLNERGRFASFSCLTSQHSSWVLSKLAAGGREI